MAKANWKSETVENIIEAMMFYGWSYEEVCGNTLYFTEGGVIDYENTVLWLQEELRTKTFIITAKEELDEDNIPNMFATLVVILKEEEENA